MKKLKKNYVMLLEILTVSLLALLDQAAKYAAVAHLKGGAGISLIHGVFELQYVENRGAAFGAMQGQRGLFLLFVLIVLAVVFWCLYKMPLQTYYLPLHLIGVATAAGAVGNMIDRLFHGYVIDFLYVSLIDFPVFNIADIYVTVSMFLLFVLLFTFYKDEEFAFLYPKCSRRKKGNA